MYRNTGASSSSALSRSSAPPYGDGSKPWYSSLGMLSWLWAGFAFGAATCSTSVSHGHQNKVILCIKKTDNRRTSPARTQGREPQFRAAFLQWESRNTYRFTATDRPLPTDAGYTGHYVYKYSAIPMLLPSHFLPRYSIPAWPNLCLVYF